MRLNLCVRLFFLKSAGGKTFIFYFQKMLSAAGTFRLRADLLPSSISAPRDGLLFTLSRALPGDFSQRTITILNFY